MVYSTLDNTPYFIKGKIWYVCKEKSKCPIKVIVCKLEAMWLVI